jgi:hypothetical protein
MEVFWNSVKKYRVLWIFTLIMLVLAIFSLSEGNTRQSLVYKDSLDKVVANVQGEDITLSDFAVYVAYQEMETHKQAVVYNPKNTKEYWGLHTNGQFIRVAVRNATVQMAVHDELFYQLSKQFEIRFTEEELAMLQRDVDDFWYDLTDWDGDEKLCITKEQVYDAFYKIAVAEKSQNIYASMDGRKYEDYNFASEDYIEFLGKYEYIINEDVLERINFGNVILVH